jgi:taurine dioxygenase
VHGVDTAAPLSGTEIRELKKLVAEFGVVVLRDQNLDDEALQVDFSNALGQTVVKWLHLGEENTFSRRDELPGRPFYSGEHPSCHYWANGPGYWDNSSDQLLQEWHADMSYLQTPLHYSILYALEAPDHGYETWFRNQTAVYESLDQETRKRTDRLSIAHDFQESFPRLSPALHPVAWKHPISGRRAIYGIPGFAAEAPVGLPPAEGKALIERINGDLDDDRFLYKHQWRKGDLVVWDNRCVIHRRGPQATGQVRILRRTQAADGGPEELRQQLLGQAS